jgi:hypothetical protein
MGWGGVFEEEEKEFESPGWWGGVLKKNLESSACMHGWGGVKKKRKNLMRQLLGGGWQHMKEF